jgi:hypothetical protein
MVDTVNTPQPLHIKTEVGIGYHKHVWEAGVKSGLSADELHDLHLALYMPQAEGAAPRPDYQTSSPGRMMLWLTTQVNHNTIISILDWIAMKGDK